MLTVIKKRGVHIHKYIYHNVVVVVGAVYIVDKRATPDKHLLFAVK